MSLVSHVDGPNRRIYLSVDTINTELNTIEVYKECRALRALENGREFYQMIEAGGHVPKVPGKYTDRFARLLMGAKIVPYPSNHSLKVITTTISDTGEEGRDCFDRSIYPDYVVDIDYFPPAVEVIEVNTAGGESIDYPRITSGIMNAILGNFNTEGSFAVKVKKGLTLSQFIGLK